MLSDREIRAALASGALVVNPLGENAVQPASIDVRLGNSFWVYEKSDVVYDPFQPAPATDAHEVVADEFILPAYTFALGRTLETVRVPEHLIMRIEGKSSLGRLGLFVHITAGFIDPGFAGTITLELLNVSGRPIKLRAGMKIAQLSVDALSSPAERPYGHPSLGSKYHGQTKATPSLYHLNQL